MKEKTRYKYSCNVGCIGCFVQIIGFMLVIWTLLHLGDIWNLIDKSLSNLIK